MRKQLLSFQLGLWLIPVLISRTLAADVVSPEVHPDRKVTFRLVAPEAKAVSVKGLAGVPPQPMTKDDDGVWSTTVGPLDPEIYSYTFSVDGAEVTDPRNRNLKKWLRCNSQVEVPGDPPRIHEVQDVPHGTLHHHLYSSSVVKRTRPLSVYTPPGYDPRESREYPVLFLLHGFGDDEKAWTEVGRAHVLADNLLARGRIRPMIIAMPSGHPIPVPRGQRFDQYAPKNRALLEKEIFEEILPLLEKSYRVSRKPQDRGIVGLSMGGGQSLGIGLRYPTAFPWVGGFSSAAPAGARDKEFAGLLKGQEEGKSPLRLLWIGCGKKDFLLERNEDFVGWLREKRVPHKYIESEGGHEWRVWRKYLAEFLPLLFREAR